MKTQGTDTKWSTRDVPWIKYKAKITDDVKTAYDAAHAAGMDFDIIELPLYAKDTNGEMIAIPERKAIFTDERHWLSIMGDRYPIFQYGEAFSFMDAISTKFVAAGTMKNQRQGFMIVQLDANIHLADDPHQLFCMLRTSQDGSRGIEVSALPLRSLCMNQLTLSSMTVGAHYLWNVKHRGDVHSKLAGAMDSLKKMSSYARQYELTVETLMSTKISMEESKNILEQTWGTNPDKPLGKRTPDKISFILTAWEHRDTIGFRGTGWGLVNAISEFCEWDRLTAASTAEVKIDNAIAGRTHAQVNRVAQAVLERNG